MHAHTSGSALRALCWRLLRRRPRPVFSAVPKLPRGRHRLKTWHAAVRASSERPGYVFLNKPKAHEKQSQLGGNTEKWDPPDGPCFHTEREELSLSFQTLQKSLKNIKMVQNGDRKTPGAAALALAFLANATSEAAEREKNDGVERKTATQDRKMLPLLVSAGRWEQHGAPLRTRFQD